MDNILKTIKRIYDKERDLHRIPDLIHSVDEKQHKCKDWLMSKLPEYKYAVALGGWYGLMAHKLGGAVSVDIDPGCKAYGKMIHPTVQFRTDDAFNYMMKYSNKHDLIVNTSCEHMEQEDLSTLIEIKRPDAVLVLQSNNYYDVAGHINCKESLDEFISEYDFKEIIYKGSLNLGDYDRWMVIGK